MNFKILTERVDTENGITSDNVYIYFNNQKNAIVSIGQVQAEDHEVNGIITDKHYIDWQNLDEIVRLKNFGDLCKEYDDFNKSFIKLSSGNFKLVLNEVDIRYEFLLVLLKIISFYNMKIKVADIIQKIQMKVADSKDSDNKITNISNSFQEFLFFRENNFNKNERKLELRIKELENSKSEINGEDNKAEIDVEINNLEEELKLYSEELSKVNNAIDRLDVPADEMKVSKEEIEKRIDFFNKYAEYILTIFVPFYIFLIIICIVYLIYVKPYNIDLVLYFTISFPLVFSTILSFLLYRQSNIKMKELQEIDRRFILIHDVKQSLKALIEVNMGTNMKRKTERIIDKLIDNILDYSSSSISTNNKSKSENNINEILSGLANLKTVTS